MFCVIMHLVVFKAELLSSSRPEVKSFGLDV
jgi:hypothetical protein